MLPFRSFILITALSAVLFSAEASEAGCRYFWVVRDGLTSPEQVDELLERAQISGANGVIVQVVGRGEAYYRSEVIPQAEFTGFDDPLDYLIMRAGPMGLEVHAWVNAFLVWSAPWEPESPDHVYHSHPEWFTSHLSGRSSRSYTQEEAEAAGLVGATLSPAYPEVREYIAEIAAEIAEKYNVAGIHLDYIRYPNSSFGFSPGEKERFFLDTGLYADNNPEEWSSWKREQVTQTVETVRAVLRCTAPDVLLSCAVMANPHSAAEEFSCDWRYWLEQGLVDLAFPMAYTSDQARALELAEVITAENPEKVVYGIGVWNQSVSNALRGAERALDLGAAGVCVFSLNSLPSGGEQLLRSSWGSGSMPDHGVSPAMFNRVVTR